MTSDIPFNPGWLIAMVSIPPKTWEIFEEIVVFTPILGDMIIPDLTNMFLKMA